MSAEPSRCSSCILVQPANKDKDMNNQSSFDQKTHDLHVSIQNAHPAGPQEPKWSNVPGQGGPPSTSESGHEGRDALNSEADAFNAAYGGRL